MADATRDNPLYAEIQAEKASAYFATIRKMQEALAALEKHDREGAGKPKANAVRDDLLATAAETAWFFIIQREAMRLPFYEEIFADFDIPDEVRKRMGPKEQPRW